VSVWGIWKGIGLIWCGGCLVGQGYEVVVYIGLAFQTSIRLNDDYDMSKSQHFIHTTHPPNSSSNVPTIHSLSFSRTSSLLSPWALKIFPTRTKNHQEFHQAIKPSQSTPYIPSTILHLIPSHPIPHQAPALPSHIPTFQHSNIPTFPTSPLLLQQTSLFILSTTDFSTVFVFVSVFFFLYYSHPLHLSPSLTHVSNCNFSS